MPIVQFISNIYLHWDFNTFMKKLLIMVIVCPMLGFEMKSVNKEYKTQYFTNIFIERTLYYKKKTNVHVEEPCYVRSFTIRLL